MPTSQEGTCSGGGSCGSRSRSLLTTRGSTVRILEARDCTGCVCAHLLPVACLLPSLRKVGLLLALLAVSHAACVLLLAIARLLPILVRSHLLLPPLMLLRLLRLLRLLLLEPSCLLHASLHATCLLPILLLLLLLLLLLQSLTSGEREGNGARSNAAAPVHLALSCALHRCATALCPTLL